MSTVAGFFFGRGVFKVWPWRVRLASHPLQEVRGSFRSVALNPKTLKP